MLFKSIKVSSSNILSIGYDRHSELLQVTFKDKEGNPTGTYVYSSVSPTEALDLIFADSIGSHFAKHIKSVKTCQKLEAQDTEVQA